MLTGIRGSGKTVTMTAIEKQITDLDDWILVRLNPVRNMLEGLVAKLYDSKEYMTKFINTNMNLSKFGIGVNLSAKPPVADIESALELMLQEIKHRHKKLLITVDEVSNTVFMQEFASCFQILIREDFPVYLLMAGLYENIQELENEKDLTFLYRTPRYEMEPLNLTLISERYRQLWNLTPEESMEMAVTTKGYPFAYQVLGKYLWEDIIELLEDLGEIPQDIRDWIEVEEDAAVLKCWHKMAAKAPTFYQFREVISAVKQEI